jgi:hypothetical protein
VTTPGPDPGLCGTCRHARIVETRRGSTFRLCERSETDPRYPRYPTLPVLACPGYESDGRTSTHSSTSRTGS